MSARILCVDDNQRNLRIMQELLEEDYELECAENGEDALASVGGVTPELILLDVMMPGIDGYEVCRTLKSNPDTASIPIVLVTARARDDERRLGYEAGASAYLAKPFDPDALLDLVEVYIPRGEERAG